MQSRKVSAKTVDRLKDEVYRQMLRLEGKRPAAQMLLAVALLNAWMTLEGQPFDCEPRHWLRNLSPVCLSLIEEICQSKCPGFAQERPVRRDKLAPNRAKMH